ncbi:phage tail family protein [Paucisalibacillus globulus]|uniref:phage tail family protein n=1 Tax=Paucisalibacillus globulus TaxID=351095 RepID=UPI0003FCF480|nr:phage tail family protein [Paucisalibacillus globulus]
MRRLKYLNSKGESIEFYQTPFLIESLIGVGEVDADVQGHRAPYQDGDTYIDTILQPRYPTLEGAITSTDLLTIKEYRKQILRVCNPKLGIGKIILEMDGDIKEILGTLDGVPTFPEKGSNVYQKFMITWKCPNPYWKSLETITEPLSAFVPKFKLPFRFPVKFGERGSEARLMNDGDVPTPIEIVFNGPATRPTIINRTTGEFIRIDKELLVGERLIINTAFGRERRVAIDKGNGVLENAWGYIDIWESTLFQLDVGENIIEYDAVASGGQAIVTISYRTQYVGV